MPVSFRSCLQGNWELVKSKSDGEANFLQGSQEKFDKWL